MTAFSRTLLSCVTAAFFAAALPAHSQTLPLSSASSSVTAVDAKWASSFAAFALADKQKAPAPGGVLFVGSSSIRLWDSLETQFSALPVVVKRGFGGSRMEDCKLYLSRLVTPYQPRMVLVYAGENDLAEGRTPEQVLRSFTSFVEGVRAELPQTRIAYISIKPSVARKGLMDQIRKTNTLIHEYVGGLNNAEYIDVFTPMLNAEGGPRAELFREDLLHLNADGYALWKSIIAPSVIPEDGPGVHAATALPAANDPALATSASLAPAR
jgi:lysophospholipase L1-like esterase